MDQNNQNQNQNQQPAQPVVNMVPPVNPVVQDPQSVTPIQNPTQPVMPVPPPQDQGPIKTLSMVLVGVVIIMTAVVGGLYFMAQSNGNKTAKIADIQPTPTVEQPTPTPTPQIEIELIDTGDPQLDLDDITKDVQGL